MTISPATITVWDKRGKMQKIGSARVKKLTFSVSYSDLLAHTYHHIITKTQRSIVLAT